MQAPISNHQHAIERVQPRVATLFTGVILAPILLTEPKPPTDALPEGKPGKQLVDTTHSRPGFASINSGWGHAWFDNFKLEKINTAF